MTVATGTRLGSYEIVSPLGAGGMGEVYRARDMRLEREVAVKVLPEELFGDADLVARFGREAKALAALNHPGIAAIHAFEEVGNRHLLVQELLEGETLRQVLASGKVPLRKALDYAVQIARALAAAHERGVVHRDLKPENLFVTSDGRVKILDFGLAKVTRPDAGAQTNLPTESRGTEPGVVLGTLGYMSPEQVRGKPADARSDIFSFGAVLYEMLSGKRAFRGDSAADTMSAILREDPADLAVSNQSLPAGLERIVRHCLEKQPEQRFHSAHDVAFALEALTGTSGVALPPVRSVAKPRLGLALALAGILAAAALGYLARGFRAPPLPSWKRLTFRRGAVWNARFAPDGQTVVYGAAWDANPIEVFLTRPESPESRPLGLKDASVFAVSPTTGELAVMLQARTTERSYERLGTLARVPIAGGTPRPVLENVRYADWTPDGRELMVARIVDGKHRIELPPGKVLYESRFPIHTPRVSPKGDAVAFFEEEVRFSRCPLRLVDLAGKVRTLGSSTDWWNLAWSPDGREIVYGAPEPGVSHSVVSVQAVSLSGKNRILMRYPGPLEIHDVARDGRVLLGRLEFESHLVGLGDDAKVGRELSWLDGAFLADLSDDGKSLLFTESEEGGGPNRAIYLRGTDGSAPTLVGEGEGLALSPDRAWVLSRELGAKGALVLLPVGVGSPRRLEPEGLKGVLSGDFFPDGKRLLIEERIPDQPARTFVLALSGGRPSTLAPAGYRLPDFGHPISPDGRRIALVDAGGVVAIFPNDGGAPSNVPGLEAGSLPIRWTSDGRSLYVYRGGGLPARLWRVEVATGRRELVREFAPADAAGVATIEGLLITPDGRFLVYFYAKNIGSLYVVSGLA